MSAGSALRSLRIFRLNLDLLFFLAFLSRAPPSLQLRHRHALSHNIQTHTHRHTHTNYQTQENFVPLRRSSYDFEGIRQCKW
uniref:Putative secreted protein n=1 Tax=Anopheles darlingi TaxID=43151 RepID=A0A2M4DPN4_ANODA